MDSNKLFEYLLMSAQNVELSPSVEDKIVNIVFSDITENAAKYYDYSQAMQFSDGLSPLFGLIRESREEGFHEACVLDKHFDKLMISNGLSPKQYHRSLRVLRERGILISQPDRIRTRKKKKKNRPDSLYYIFKY